MFVNEITFYVTYQKSNMRKALKKPIELSYWKYCYVYYPLLLKDLRKAPTRHRQYFNGHILLLSKIKYDSNESAYS